MNRRKKINGPLIFLMALLFSSLTQAAEMTVQNLREAGYTPLNSAQIKQLIVGNIVVVRNTDTLNYYAARFDKNGKRIAQRVIPLKDGPDIIYQTYGDDKAANVATYEIKKNRLITKFESDTFEMRIYRIKETYYAARSSDNGEVNWELVLITQQ
jgi:hypothetical protein